MSTRLPAIALLFAALSAPLSAQYTISTIAGGGPADGTPALNVAIPNPAGIARDSAGNLYVASSDGDRVYKVDTNSLLSVFAGTAAPTYSGDGGPAAAASMSHPLGLAVDTAGNVFIADVGNRRIRKVSNGVITTVAGGNNNGPPGDGGPATSANIYPYGVAVDGAGNLYITEPASNRIRKVSGGIITTIAGNGTAGFSGDNGPATSALLSAPAGIAVDSSGENIFIADSGNNRIRKISNGVISTVAGNGSRAFSGDNVIATSAGVGSPSSVTVDSGGALYITDNSSRIRRVVNGVIATVAGNGI